jgi:ABC-type Fe3+ transport system permease subunit
VSDRYNGDERKTIKGVSLATQNSKNKGSKNKKKQVAAQTGGSGEKKQGGITRVLTIIICVIVALGLMLPTAGIGAASCSPASTQTPTQTQTQTPNQQ